MFLHQITNVISPRCDLVFILSLDHNPEQWFSTGITNQNPPFIAKLFLDIFDFGSDISNGIDIHLFPNTSITQYLW